MPHVLNGNVTIKQGADTEAVRDQEEIQKLFPITYGRPIVQFVESSEPSKVDGPVNVGVTVSYTHLDVYKRQLISLSTMSSRSTTASDNSITLSVNKLFRLTSPEEYPNSCHDIVRISTVVKRPAPECRRTSSSGVEEPVRMN